MKFTSVICSIRIGQYTARAQLEEIHQACRAGDDDLDNFEKMNSQLWVQRVCERLKEKDILNYSDWKEVRRNSQSIADDFPKTMKGRRPKVDFPHFREHITVPEENQSIGVAAGSGVAPI
jgi:hypothetical protein